MGYVDGYDYDYFLSYAHVDNEPVPGTDAQEGWVSLFFEALNYELKALSGGRIRSPWKDGKIPLHKPLDGELIGAVGRAAVLVVLLSPGYTLSDWCRKELQAFRSACFIPSLNTRTARAIAPVSSRRSVPGTGASRSHDTGPGMRVRSPHACPIMLKIA